MILAASQQDGQRPSFQKMLGGLWRSVVEMADALAVDLKLFTVSKQRDGSLPTGVEEPPGRRISQ
jgi:hypothetical protein